MMLVRWELQQLPLLHPVHPVQVQLRTMMKMITMRRRMHTQTQMRMMRSPVQALSQDQPQWIAHSRPMTQNQTTTWTENSTRQCKLGQHALWKMCSSTTSTLLTASISALGRKPYKICPRTWATFVWLLCTLDLGATCQIVGQVGLDPFDMTIWPTSFWDFSLHVVAWYDWLDTLLAR